MGETQLRAAKEKIDSLSRRMESALSERARLAGQIDAYTQEISRIDRTNAGIYSGIRADSIKVGWVEHSNPCEMRFQLALNLKGVLQAIRQELINELASLQALLAKQEALMDSLFNEASNAFASESK